MLIIFMSIYLKVLFATDSIFFVWEMKKGLHSNAVVGSINRVLTVYFGKVQTLTCKMTPLVQLLRSGHWWNWRFVIQRLLDGWWKMCLNIRYYDFRV